jgi:hypothetical protein
MKEDIKDILLLLGIAAGLYVLSSASAFPLFQIIFKYGTRIFAFLFAFFAALCVMRLIIEFVKNINKPKE